jgi:hypothetical protein
MDFVYWSDGKPTGVSEVAVMSVDDSVTISDTVPGGYARADIAAQIVYHVRRKSFEV